MPRGWRLLLSSCNKHRLYRTSYTFRIASRDTPKHFPRNLQLTFFFFFKMRREIYWPRNPKGYSKIETFFKFFTLDTFQRSKTRILFHWPWHLSGISNMLHLSESHNQLIVSSIFRLIDYSLYAAYVTVPSRERPWATRNYALRGGRGRGGSSSLAKVSELG